MDPLAPDFPDLSRMNVDELLQEVCLVFQTDVLLIAFGRRVPWHRLPEDVASVWLLAQALHDFNGPTVVLAQPVRIPWLHLVSMVPRFQRQVADLLQHIGRKRLRRTLSTSLVIRMARVSTLTLRPTTGASAAGMAARPSIGCHRRPATPCQLACETCNVPGSSDSSRWSQNVCG